MNPSVLYAELKRRRVMRVAAIYLVAGWAAIELAYIAFPVLQLPPWAIRLVLALVITGFVPTMLLTWAFDITPGGLVRTPPAGSDAEPLPARPIYTTVLAALTMWALGIGAYAKYELENLPAPFWSTSVGGHLDMVAVLPFEDADGDEADAYLSSGIASELASTLAKLPALRSTASPLSFSMPGDGSSADAAGRTAVLSGTMRRTGSMLRIAARLSAADGTSLWSGVYDTAPTDIFHVQDEIRRAVTRTLRPELSRAAYAAAPPPTTSSEAYDLYLRGRWLWQRRTPESLAGARELLERAVELDSDFARAHAALASVHVLMPLYTSADPRAEFARATTLAARALTLDTTLAEPHATRAFTHLHTGNSAGSIAEYERALTLEPSFATGHHWYAWTLLALGRHEDALARVREALELQPSSLVIRASLGEMLYYLDRYDDAVAALQAVLQLDPEFHHATALLAITHAVHGRVDAALPYVTRIEALRDPTAFARAAAAYVLARAGRKDAARVIAEDLEREGAWALAARVHMGLGDTARVYTALARAAGRHDPFTAHELTGEPIFAPLHDSPQFIALRQSIGLP